MKKVITIPALGDNYIYLYRYDQENAFVVDPSEARAVFKVLEKHSLNLTHILVTHHHFDHVGGIQEIMKKTGCNVIIANKARIFQIANTNIQVITTPGHTRDSVCYYVQPTKNQEGVLFTGDTLFIGGCGRPIECNAQTMWNSLQKIAALPDDTLVYPGHNYTEENYDFALMIEPNNKLVKKALQTIKEWQRLSKPTVPSNIGQERATNIFLRSDDPEVKTVLDMPDAKAGEIFAELRRRKNIFG